MTTDMLRAGLKADTEGSSSVMVLCYSKKKKKKAAAVFEGHNGKATGHLITNSSHTYCIYLVCVHLSVHHGECVKIKEQPSRFSPSTTWVAGINLQAPLYFILVLGCCESSTSTYCQPSLLCVCTVWKYGHMRSAGV